MVYLHRLAVYSYGLTDYFLAPSGGFGGYPSFILFLSKSTLQIQHVLNKELKPGINVF